MMKQHRSSRARTLGGALSIALAGLAGAAISGGPGFAHQEAAPARILATVAAPRAIAAAAELPVFLAEAKKPEAQIASVRSVRKEKPREVRAALARVKLDAPKIDSAVAAEAAAPQQLAEIASMVPAVPAPRHVQHLADHRLHVRAALIRAQARIAAAAERRPHPLLASAHPQQRPHFVTVKVNGATRREIELALLEAGHAVWSANLARELTMVEHEVKRELKVVDTIY